ncbi:Peptidyl-tRNA hydrolase PTH2 [Musa troglodytarum]|uniref:peptidyl-tRNA hydrolase n=1 Tax=Musa troglodytarum TaxID=320322 RepID=A0A9E7JZ27_9LILI|nr:Peptidyl-tRNA hydrolase PTH2 [Musa troglodytarum]
MPDYHKPYGPSNTVISGKAQFGPVSNVEDNNTTSPCRRLSVDSSTNRSGVDKEEEPWLAQCLKPENYLPGMIIGFLLGLFLDLSATRRISDPRGKSSSRPGKHQSMSAAPSSSSSRGTSEELKMVLIVRQDLKMGAGKIASQCAHAATGMYAELLQRNKLKEAADRCGLPTFVVADAGRTQVLAGSRTVLAIGPGRKADIDSVTGKLRLL